MYLKLSDRLQTIAEHISPGKIVADIGTDHGYIPIWLLERGICSQVILSDVNQGPLDKAAENFNKYLPGRKADLRLGSGLEILKQREADVVIIAGMGGILIRDIMLADFPKTTSVSKFILQPRNNSAILRKWLNSLDEFLITDEEIVREADKFCEIITISSRTSVDEDSVHRIAFARQFMEKSGIAQDFFLSLPAMYFYRENEVVKEYLIRRYNTEQRIIQSIDRNSHSEVSVQKKSEAEKRALYIRKLTEYISKGSFS